VRVILDSFPDVAVVGEAQGVEEAARALAAMSDPPDLVITAPHAPGLPVHELLPHVRSACPTSCILVLAEDFAPDDLAAVAASGIERYAGYLLWRDLSAATLRQCIGAVAGGDVLTVSRAVAETFIQGSSRAPAARDPSGRPPVALSEQERAVLGCLAAGQTGCQVAESLGISVRTVKRVVSRLHDALGTPTHFALGARATVLGLLPQKPDEPTTESGGIRP